MNKIYYTLSFLFINLVLQAQVLDRSKRPVPAPAPAVKMGATTSFELSNGLKVFVVENHEVPSVAFSMQLNIDPILEGESKGLVNITGQLLGTGSTTKTKDQIENEIDFIGAAFYPSSDGFYASCLKKHQDRLLAVVSDAMLNPEFKQEELDKLKRKRIASIQTQKDDPDAISDNVKSVLLFGKNHPYGEITTEETVGRVTLEKCKNYYTTFFRPNVAYLAIVGDVKPEEARLLAEKYFGKWQKGEVPKKQYNVPPLPKNRRVIVVHKPGAVQSLISVTYPVDMQLGNPEYIKSRVLLNILGGSFTGRLFMNLREKRAFTYGSYAQLAADPLSACFEAYAKTRNAVTDSAAEEIINEMKDLVINKVKNEELEGTKRYIMGNFSIQLENPQTVANYAINIEKYKLPRDFYTNYLKNIAAVTAEDVQMTAQHYLKHDNAYLIVVGDKAEVVESLKRLSPTQLVEVVDIYGNPVKEIKPVPAGITPSAVIEKYQNAIGGSAAIQKITDIKVAGTLSLMGQTLDLTILKKGNTKALFTITSAGKPLQRIAYNEGKAKESGMMGNREFTGKELEEKKIEAVLFPEFSYERMGYQLQLKGLEELNGKEVYVMEVKSPLGNITTEYYSVADGLKIQQVETSETPQGSMTQVVTINSYREVQGVKIPVELIQTVGPQVIKIVVNTIDINTKLGDELFKLDQ